MSAKFALSTKASKQRTGEVSMRGERFLQQFVEIWRDVLIVRVAVIQK
jgi:hypothetical protein